MAADQGGERGRVSWSHAGPRSCGRGGDGHPQGLPKSVGALSACSWCRPVVVVRRSGVGHESERSADVCRIWLFVDGAGRAVLVPRQLAWPGTSSSRVTHPTGKDETQQPIDLGGPSDAIGRDRSRKVRSHSGQGGSILNSFRDGPHCVMRLNRSEIALAHRRLAGRDATPMSASERSAPREGGWFNRLNQRLEMRGQPRECAPTSQPAQRRDDRSSGPLELIPVTRMRPSGLAAAPNLPAH